LQNRIRQDCIPGIKVTYYNKYRPRAGINKGTTELMHIQIAVKTVGGFALRKRE